MPREFNLRETDIRRLQSNLYMVMHHTLSLSIYPTPEIRKKFEEITHDSHEDLDEWERSTIKLIVESTKFEQENPYDNVRAVCPLCGHGSSDPYAKGFTPTGLERHLEGFGNVQQCFIMSIAWELGWEYVKHEKERAREKVIQDKKDAKTPFSKWIKENSHFDNKFSARNAIEFLALKNSPKAREVEEEIRKILGKRQNWSIPADKYLSNEYNF
jgi:hypothetical protein